MDHSVIAGRGHRNTGLLEFARIGFTFVTKWVILGGDDERQWQARQFLLAGAERRHIGVVARLLVRSVKIPSVLHEGTCQEAAGSKLMIGVSIDASVGRGDEKHLISDLRAIAILGQ